jgi:hypothetical protein
MIRTPKLCSIVQRERAMTITMIGAIVALALTGCNELTGAKDVETLANSPASSNGGSAGSVDTGGHGGAAGGTASAGGDSNNGGGGTIVPTVCTWPEGPYDVTTNTTVAESHSWEGYAEYGSQPETIGIDSYFDCDGSQEINAILISTHQFYCPACEAEAAYVVSHLEEYEQKGIKVLFLLVDDPAKQYPPTTAGVLQYKTALDLDGVAVVADPTYAFLPAGTTSFGTPLETIVDPRTMTVVNTQEGWSGGLGALEALAETNSDP